MREDFAELVPFAESLVCEHTRLEVRGFRSRGWVMSRTEWMRQNLNGLQRVLDPLAERILAKYPQRSEIKRQAMGAQAGALFGYIARRVLGQYDVLLPPDDEGLLYFVGPNVAETERRYSLPPRDFRLWVAMHEVTHRVQFSAASWLRGHLAHMVNAYLDSVSVESGDLLEQLRRAIDEIRAGANWRGAGAVYLILNPEQRTLFKRMQGMMSLLEGHASFVMNEVAREHVADVDRMRRALAARRRSSRVDRTVQKAIGFEQKIRQYDSGERFVRQVVDRIGIQGFNLVWDGPGSLPSVEEIAEPRRWVERVATG
jgi:coenzyme F420 biosynthesis associated uncharacterized protein